MPGHAGADSDWMTSVASDRTAERADLVEVSRERMRRGLVGRERAATMAGSLAFLGAALSLALTVDSQRAFSAPATVILVSSLALASRVEFEIGTGSAIPTQLIFVPMLFLLPAPLVPLLVAVGLVLGLLPDVIRRRANPQQLLVQLHNSVHALGAALVLILAGEPRPSLAGWPLSVLLLALLGQFGVDFLGAAFRSRVAFGMRLSELPALLAPVYLVDLVLAPLGLAIAIVAVDRPAAVLLGMPLVGLLAYFARQRQQRIDDALELSHAYRGTALLLGDVVEADDAYTGSHSKAVVDIVLAVVEELRLTSAERRQAEFVALLHDVGKIAIPKEIINKPGPLTGEERRLVETHTIVGEQLLARVGGMLGEVGRIVRSCHERWDGTGYPDGLAGDRIPIVARIVACCDAFDAMTTDRSYRKALPLAAALAELERNSGSQFDPVVVSALLRIVTPSS